MIMRSLAVGIAVATAICAFAGSAVAQNYPQLAAARRAGQVGERFDGYLGYPTAPSAALQKQVAAINIRRRALYVNLASRRRVTPQVAGIATGCELLSRIGVGEVYMLQDGVWRRRDAGEAPPQPAYCG
jgi:uncharacterized protein YdbL (DUF1318 family)